MDKQKVWTCHHCGRTFTNVGEWMNHDCDQLPPMPTPAKRDVAAILNNAPRCQVEESGDMLWA